MKNPYVLPRRPRRLRKSPVNRGLMRETYLQSENLIYPMFLCGGQGQKQPIETLPGQFRWSVDRLVEACAKLLPLGVGTVNLFGQSRDKDPTGASALDPEGLVPRAVRALKADLPELCVQTDIALDPYTDHGHDGVLIDGRIDNDASLEVLARMAVLHAEAGADWVAPSDMMDGRVGVLRSALDGAGFTQTCILAYSVKYASCFYGPFRGALDAAPLQGPPDKKTYQMDPANRREALLEIQIDLEEGADAVMVKPAGMYLDVVHAVRDAVNLPVAAYQVSGEYAMIHAAAQKGWLDLHAAMLESVLCIRRAGADMILTYFAPELAKTLNESVSYD
jgi:porphobilinogen synthase